MSQRVESKIAVIHLRIWSVNMIWYQIVEGFKILIYASKVRLSALQNINELLTFQQSDIKSCLLIIFEDEWWNFRFDTNNSKISKKVRLKTTHCESRHEIDRRFILFEYSDFSPKKLCIFMKIVVTVT